MLQFLSFTDIGCLCNSLVKILFKGKDEHKIKSKNRYKTKYRLLKIFRSDINFIRN